MESSFARGIALDPHVIACDGGSTDAGPASSRQRQAAFLARGNQARPAADAAWGATSSMCRSSSAPAASAAAMPASTGCATSRWRSPARRVCSFKLATGAQRAGQGLSQAPLARGAHHAAQSGAADQRRDHRPERAYRRHDGARADRRAIERGAQVVLCGRASDTSLFATVPLMQGAGAGPAWHAAKILECGTACVVQRKRPDSIMALGARRPFRHRADGHGRAVQRRRASPRTRSTRTPIRS